MHPHRLHDSPEEVRRASDVRHILGTLDEIELDNVHVHDWRDVRPAAQRARAESDLGHLRDAGEDPASGVFAELGEVRVRPREEQRVRREKIAEEVPVVGEAGVKVQEPFPGELEEARVSPPTVTSLLAVAAEGVRDLTFADGAVGTEEPRGRVRGRRRRDGSELCHGDVARRDIGGTPGVPQVLVAEIESRRFAAHKVRVNRGDDLRRRLLLGRPAHLRVRGRTPFFLSRSAGAVAAGHARRVARDPMTRSPLHRERGLGYEIPAVKTARFTRPAREVVAGNGTPTGEYAGPPRRSRASSTRALCSASPGTMIFGGA